MKEVTKNKLIFVGTIWFSIFFVTLTFGCSMVATSLLIEDKEIILLELIFTGFVIAILFASLFSIIPIVLIIGEKDFKLDLKVT